MVEESFADFGSLKIDRAWPALDLFSVVKEVFCFVFLFVFGAVFTYFFFFLSGR